MTRSVSYRSGILGLLVTFGRILVGQTADHKDMSRHVQETAFVSCCDESWKDCKSTDVRGPVLIAPDGRHRAYAEVKAQVTGKLQGDNDMPDCHNHTTLFVSTDGKTFNAVFDYKGEQSVDGNGIQLIDWSADSNTLIADLIVWKYYSEGWAHDVLIHSAASGNTKRQPLNDVFSKIAKQPCAVDAELLGFLNDGRISVHVIPSDEFEDAPCVGESRWAMNASNFDLNAVQKDLSAKKNGHFENPQ